MRGLSVGAAVFIVFAAASGCIEAADEGDPPEERPSPETSRAAPSPTRSPERATASPGQSESRVREYSGAFDLVLTQLATPAYKHNQDLNCVELTNFDQILNGTATLTWDAQSPLAATMHVSLWADDVFVSADGPSPLTYEFGEMHEDSQIDGILVSAQFGDVGAAVMQAVQLTLHVTYESSGGVLAADHNHSCSGP